MTHYKEKLLKEGKTFVTTEQGNSMTPRLKSGEKHTLTPCELSDLVVGDIVFCKVKGKYYTHLVTALNTQKGAQIGNNHGHINGWTRQVFGKVIQFNS